MALRAFGSTRQCRGQRLVVRANRADKLAALVGTTVASFAAAAQAAYQPSVDALNTLPLEAARVQDAAAPVVASAVDGGASEAVSAAPLVGGLAFGIALAGAGVAYFQGEAGAPTTKTASAEAVLQLLTDDPTAQIVDIREKDESRDGGSPDLKGTKKSLIALPFKPSEGPKDKTSTISIGWAERVWRQGKIKPDGTIVLLDADGSVAGLASKDLAAAAPELPEGVKPGAIVRVPGGAQGWKAAELPWKETRALGLNFGDAFKSIDISGINVGTENFADKYNQDSSAVKGATAVAAVTGASVFVVSELEYLLQVVGVAFLLQFLVRRLLFAEQREKTFADFKSLFRDKIAAGEAGSDLRRLADAVLEVDSLKSLDGVTDRAAAQTQQMARAAAASGQPGTGVNVDANVSEARAWIAAWRSKAKAPAQS